MNKATVTGAVAFCAASMAVFGSWAFVGRRTYKSLGELGAYAVWAGMVVVIAGFTLHRIVASKATLKRFWWTFAVAFLLYAVGWTAAWFTLRNHFGEVLGSLVGTLLMSAVFLKAFGAGSQTREVILNLFLGHSAGYFLGAVFYSTLHGRPGMLLWGLCYGLGFGAGIGRALFVCKQTAADR